MASMIPTANMFLETALLKKYERISRGTIQRIQWLLFAFNLILVDIASLGLAFRVAYWIRFDLYLPVFQLNIPSSYAYYRGLIFIIIPISIGIFAAFGLFNRANLLGGTLEYSRAFNAITLVMMFLIAFDFLDIDFVLARGFLLLAWMLSIFFVWLGRFLNRRLVYFLRHHGFFLSTALIVGSNAESRSLAEQLLRWKTSGLAVIGYIDKSVPADASPYHNLPCLGTLDNLPAVLERYHVNELILTTSALTRDDMVSIFKEYGVSSDVNLRLSSGLFEIITTGLQVSEMASAPLVRVNKARLTGADRTLKLLLDYMIAIPALLLAAPLLLLIALAVRLDSPGPIIYRRRVMGVNGRQFDAYKFRSMYVNGDEILARYPDLQNELARNHKLVNDPRITRIGRFLRKTSLDELPQLFNVIKREMSLVGPRMIAPTEMRKYDQWDMNLLTVRPGITGLWQVSGRSDVSYDERVRLDMYYIRNWSIWLDLQLIVNTIPAVLKGRGAY